MEKKNYLLVKNRFNKEVSYINYDREKGFIFNPVNNDDDSISVNQMVIINPNFISRILTKKTKRKLELYLQYIVELLDEDSDIAKKINEKELHIAVVKVLNELDSVEKIIIQDLMDSVSMTITAKKLKVSKQAVAKKRNKLLEKLKNNKDIINIFKNYFS